MILYTNGCSHTHGTANCLGKNYRDLNWAATLFRIGSFSDWQDSSIQGNNNKLLVSKVVQDLVSGTYKPDYAVIQFTYPSRFRTPGKNHQPNATLWNEVAKKAEFDTGLSLNKQQVRWHKRSHITHCGNNKVTDIDTAFYDQYYRGREPQVECTIEMFTEIKLVETLLKSLDIKYTFIIWPRIYAECYSSVEKTIDHSRVLNYGHGEYFDMDRMMPTYGFNYPRHTHHFEEPGQQFIANAVYNHMTQGTKLIPAHKIEQTNEQFIDELY
tara:strand:+ start:21 stop:827 length:807 start_codon:yes stop_codon:yes gene_type:complete